MNTKLITLNELNETMHTMDVVFTDIAKIKYDEAHKDNVSINEYYTLVHDLTDGKYIVLDIIKNTIKEEAIQENVAEPVTEQVAEDEPTLNINIHVGDMLYAVEKNYIKQLVNTESLQEYTLILDKVFVTVSDILDIKYPKKTMPVTLKGINGEEFISLVNRLNTYIKESVSLMCELNDNKCVNKIIHDKLVSMSKSSTLNVKIFGTFMLNVLDELSIISDSKDSTEKQEKEETMDNNNPWKVYFENMQKAQQETKIDIDEWNGKVMNDVTGKKDSLEENTITALNDLMEAIFSNDFEEDDTESDFTIGDYDSLDIKEKSDLFVSALINEHVAPNTPEEIEELIFEISKKIDELNVLTSKPEPKQVVYIVPTLKQARLYSYIEEQLKRLATVDNSDGILNNTILCLVKQVIAEHEGYLYRTVAQTSNSHIPVRLLTFMNDKINTWTTSSNEGCILSVEDID